MTSLPRWILVAAMAWMHGAVGQDVERPIIATASVDRPVLQTSGDDEWVIATHADKKKNSPDLDMLLRVQLPPNPTRSEVANYINVIFMLSRNQRTELDGDPQVTMLAKVGREHLDLLLASSASGMPTAKYGILAIAMLVDERDKKWVLSNLRGNYGLARVVIRKNWCADAASILASMLGTGSGYIESDGIACLVQLRDRKYYPALISYMMNGWNPHSTYGQIKNLPGIDLRTALPKVWEDSRGGSSYQLTYLTNDTLKMGYLPAFHFLFDVVNGDVSLQGVSLNFEGLIRQYATVSGSKAEILAWYRENKAQIRFDSKLGKFSVP